jgi:hypothetical protein
MAEVTLSILISTSKERKSKFEQLIAILLPQLRDLPVEVLVETDSKSHESTKLNSLLKDALGKYVWIIGDVDHISSTAVSDILEATEHDPDIIGLKGMITQDKSVDTTWSLVNPAYFLPIKKEKTPKFSRVKDWQNRWKNKLPKELTEIIIERPVYHERK